MARQSLKLRKIAVDLQAFRGGKPTIREIRDFLKGAGHLETDPDAVDQWELAQTRAILQKVRRFGTGDDAGTMEFVALVEHDEGGSPREYWRLVADCTLDEAVQHLDYWRRQGRVADGRFHEYFRKFSATHDPKAIQLRLKYDLPPDPGIVEEEGDRAGPA